MKLNRALLVDDDPSWREILRELLEDSGYDVDEACHLDQALDLVQSTHHRVAVVDLSLSGADHRNQDGLQVLDTLAERDPGCQVLLLTGFATVELAVGVITEGKAKTCLRKEKFSRQDFLELLSQCQQPSILDALTEREREVLDHLAGGMTNQAIAEALFISPNTVKRHLKVVFDKLQVKNRAQAAALVTRENN